MPRTPSARGSSRVDADDAASARSGVDSRADAAPRASSPSDVVELAFGTDSVARELDPAGAFDAGAAPVYHVHRAGRPWYMTAEDNTKTVAKWQLELTKMTRRAKSAEASAAHLKRAHDDLHARLEREHRARVAMETELAHVFSRPEVKDALRGHVEDAAAATHPDDGSVAAARVFRALEARIARDRDALEAAHARELRLVETARNAEAEKLGAFAVAKRAQEELRAHVARLRVDNQVRADAQREMLSDAADARELPIVRRKLVDAEMELERLRESEARRVELQREACRAAVRDALATRRDETAIESERLADALRVARTRLGESDWEHARARESAESEHAAAIAGVVARARELEEALEAQTRETRHADAERARVADEAAAVVERAVAQREWALRALDRAVEDEEAHAKRLHYELYRASLLAMPEVAVRSGEETLPMETRAVADAFRRQAEETRASLAELRRDVDAMVAARDAARDVGVAEGWSAALAAAEAHTRRAGPKDWPAARRLEDKIRKGREDAAHRARRGEARRRLLAHLGREMPPPTEASFRRLFMPAEPTVVPPSASSEAEPSSAAEPSSDPADRRSDPPTPPPPPTRAETDRDADATDHFYDAETTIWTSSAMPTGRDYHYDAETSPESAARAAGGAGSVAAASATPDESWIADARAAAAASARRSRTPSVAPLSPADANVDANATSRSRGGSDRADPSARKRLEFTPDRRGSNRGAGSGSRFGTPAATRVRLEEPGALLGATPFFTPASGYTPSKSAAREIESLVKNLRF